RLAEARHKALHPLSEAWGEASTLLETIEQAADPDDARLRLRDVLRRIIESVWLMVVPREQGRLAAVQLHFAGGPQPSYVIFHRRRRGNGTGRIHEGVWSVESFADIPVPGDLDLRKPADVRHVERVLGKLDLAGLGE